MLTFNQMIQSMLSSSQMITLNAGENVIIQPDDNINVIINQLACSFSSQVANGFVSHHIISFHFLASDHFVSHVKFKVTLKAD